MYFLLFLVVLMLVYIKSFKDDFTAEHLDKVKPYLIGLVAVIVALSILSYLVTV